MQIIQIDLQVVTAESDSRVSRPPRVYGVRLAIEILAKEQTPMCALFEERKAPDTPLVRSGRLRMQIATFLSCVSRLATLLQQHGVCIKSNSSAGPSNTLHRQCMEVSQPVRLTSNLAAVLRTFLTIEAGDLAETISLRLSR